MSSILGIADPPQARFYFAMNGSDDGYHLVCVEHWRGITGQSILHDFSTAPDHCLIDAKTKARLASQANADLCAKIEAELILSDD